MGMKDDLLAAFMMSSILLNPQLMIYSAALGADALLIRTVSCFLCGVAAGALVRQFYGEKAFFDFTGFGGPKNRDIDPNLLLRFLKNLGRNVKATGPYFLAGVLLSALFQRYVPSKAMTSLFGGNEAFGVLMAATIGVPLYACGGGTIPLLQQWLADGMSMGQRRCFYDYRPGHQNYQSWRFENCAGAETVFALSCLYNGILFCHGHSGQLDLANKTNA